MIIHRNCEQKGRDLDDKSGFRVRTNDSHCISVVWREESESSFFFLSFFFWKGNRLDYYNLTSEQQISDVAGTLVVFA